jgi:hypothetical protein
MSALQADGVSARAPVISPSSTETMSSNNAMPTPTANAESSERVLLRPTIAER